jgi:hypothetical protein
MPHAVDMVRLISIIATAIAACNAQYHLQSTFAGETFFDNFVSIS